MPEKNYSRDIDILIALTTYLAMTEYKSMRPSKLAERLSLNETDVVKVMETYKGIFRKSIKTNIENKEYYYTLHSRYALRWRDDEDNPEETNQPKLPPEYLSTILGFLSDRVKQEEMMGVERIKNWITLIAALIAAGASIITAYITLHQK